MKYLYEFEGKVRKGKDRGKRLGFPTANMDLSQKIPEGVYISETIFEQKTHPSLTFIGRAKTFNEYQYQAETYVLNFNQDLYGQTIEVKLLKKLRDNKKFGSEQELIDQMEKDKKQAEDYFLKEVTL